MSIEALEGLTDEQLFSDANADEDTTEQVVAEPAPEPEAVTEQPTAAGVEPAEPVATDPPARTPVDDNAPQVPSWRVREINEEKRAALAELETLRAERAQWQQRQQTAPQPVKEPEKVAKPDPLIDPVGYEAYLEEKFEARQINTTREIDLRLTRQSNVEIFDKAYGESQRLKEARDPAFLELSQKMNNTMAPGKVLLDWYNQRTLQAEVGTDLNAFRQREQERLLSDPAFLAKAIEKARVAAQPSTQPGAKTPSATSLPPSLTRATNASTITSADDDDVSDDGLWRHANA
jgi:hypothetical protein